MVIFYSYSLQEIFTYFLEVISDDFMADPLPMHKKSFSTKIWIYLSSEILIKCSFFIINNVLFAYFTCQVNYIKNSAVMIYISMKLNFPNGSDLICLLNK